MAGEFQPDERTILVSMQYPEPVQRFTLAHELGHAVLHPEVEVAHRDPPYFGDVARTQRTLPAREKEANRFAAELLMPRRAYRRAVLERFGFEEIRLRDLDDGLLRDTVPFAKSDRFRGLGPRGMTARDLSELLAQVNGRGHQAFPSLADVFRVSVLAAAIRLEELGIVLA